MIYTRFGITVDRIDSVDIETGEVLCQVNGDVEWHRYSIAELKADGGIHEIIESARHVIRK